MGHELVRVQLVGDSDERDDGQAEHDDRSPPLEPRLRVRTLPRRPPGAEAVWRARPYRCWPGRRADQRQQRASAPATSRAAVRRWCPRAEERAEAEYHGERAEQTDRGAGRAEQREDDRAEADRPPTAQVRVAIERLGRGCAAARPRRRPADRAGIGSANPLSWSASACTAGNSAATCWYTSP